MRTLVARLCEYEETGLTPDEVLELKRARDDGRVLTAEQMEAVKVMFFNGVCCGETDCVICEANGINKPEPGKFCVDRLRGAIETLRPLFGHLLTGGKEEQG
jgi:hypothetical protein